MTFVSVRFIFSGFLQRLNTLVVHMIMIMRQMDRFQFMEIKLLADTSYITIFAESEKLHCQERACKSPHCSHSCAYIEMSVVYYLLQKLFHI